jgi:hypothetical protein
MFKFKYLVVTRNRAQFLIEEESGRGLYRAREFLGMVKGWFPGVVFRKFKGRPRGREFADLDLVLVVPTPAGTGLLELLLEAFIHVLINEAEPSARVSIPRQELRIELGGRSRRGQGTEMVLGSTFATPSKKLVALLRFDAIDPAWVRGTEARVPVKHHFAFFIAHHDRALYRGKRGTLRSRSGLPGDEGNR